MKFTYPHTIENGRGETLTFEEEDESGEYPRTFDVVYIPQLDEDGKHEACHHIGNCLDQRTDPALGLCVVQRRAHAAAS